MSAKKSRYLRMKGWTIPFILGAIAISMVLIACGSADSPEPASSGSTGSGSTASSQQTGSGVTDSSQQSGTGAATSTQQTGGSSSPTTSTSPAMPEAMEASEYASLKGDIEIDGSSTVFPITEAVAEEFGYLTEGNVRVTVGVSGTGGGFKKFCNGETQISDASRPIKASEVQLCADAGLEYIEIPVAIDGLTVIVNKDNTWAQCMTVDELHTMWAPESEDVITRWNQVRPDWPEDDMEMYAPGVDSGTFDYFTETVNGDGGASRGDFTASEDDNLIIQGVSGGKNGVGYLGYSYYIENAEKLNAVAIDGGAGCVTPTDEVINNGAYAPLSRPLFIYVRADAAGNPHIAEFVRYFLSKEGQGLAAEVGYIPYPQPVYDLALAKFENGTSGTVFGGENPRHGSVEDILAGRGSTAKDEGDTTMEMPTVDYPSLKGDIEVDGSSTVFPITEAVAEEFGYLTEGNVRVTVGVSGTGGGFKKFCNGETQISDASRPIKASEVQLCADAGLDYIEIPVAIDGLTVIVNKDNTWAQCMTVDELHTMWAPESEDVITKWNQVRPDWPDDDMEMYAPGVDSGTFDYFTETVNGDGGASRGDFTASEDDNLIIQGVSGGKNGVGYLGYSYYIENAEKLNAVAIDGGAGCVTPTDEVINNGAYAPLSRPLFIYVRADAAGNPHIAEFVRYFLSKEGQGLAAEVGYIPYPQTVYDLALAKFENGTSGTAFGGENPMHGSVEEILANSQ